MAPLPPVITGQRVNPMIVGKNRVLTVHLTDLLVDNPDYPDGSGNDWELDSHSGAHYTADPSSGVTDSFDVIPDTGYVGPLSVYTRVTDGFTWSGWYGLNVSVVEVPMILNQKSFPKVYIGSYLTISLDTLVVHTTKPYPASFTMVAAEGPEYSIAAATDTYVKVLVSGNPTHISRSIPVRVNDGAVWSEAYSYIVNVVLRPRSSKPVPFNVDLSQPSPFEQPFRRV